MSANLCIVIVRDGAHSIHVADGGLFALLLEGPAGLEKVAALPTLQRLPSALQAGWLVDTVARRVALYHAPDGEVVLPPIEMFGSVYTRWDGFSVRWTDDDSGGLAAYLAGDHRIFDEEDSPPESDPVLDARLEQLREEDREIARPPQPGAGIGFLVALLLVAPVALVVRLVTLPFRRRLRDWSDDRARARMRNAAGAARQAMEAPEAQGATIDAGFHRGLACMLGAQWADAEVEFDACVRRLEAGEPPGLATLARALHNRGVARSSLGLGGLAARDRSRAESLDATLARPSKPGWGQRLQGYRVLTGGLFLAIAGLSD